jgi:signal transduction histidine kinase
MGRALTLIPILALGLAVGVYTLAVVRDDPATSFAGSSNGGAVALLAAGWALVGAGTSLLARRGAGRVGFLLVAAGFAWFLLEWDNPEVGSALVFTIGLCLYAACAPLVSHALLAYPGGKLARRTEQAAVAVAYAGGVLVLGVLPALFWSPSANGCNDCPRNLLLVADEGTVAEDLRRGGLYLGLAWALILAGLLVIRLLEATSTARRASWLLLAAGAGYLGLVAATFGGSLDRGFLWNGALERRLWAGEAAALVAVGIALGWSWVRGRRARSQVAGLVVELARSPSPGGLRDVLAAIVGDPELLLGYPIGDAGELVDATGRPVVASSRSARTSLVRDGQVVAVLAHAPGLLDDEQLVDEVAAAARLGLQNERLQVDVRARLEELRASRARIVAAGDAERKRLERDLHDGAQQRLVALALSLRLLRSHVDGDARRRVDEADQELSDAISELRELSYGIFPAVLADGGLAPAVQALAEGSRVPIAVGPMPEARPPHAIEIAAYAVVAEAARAARTRVAVHAERRNGGFVIEVATQETAPLELVALEDRVGALDGRVTVERGEEGRVTIRGEFPCEW